MHSLKAPAGSPLPVEGRELHMSFIRVRSPGSWAHSGPLLHLAVLCLVPGTATGQSLPVPRSRPIPPLPVIQEQISLEAGPTSPAALRATSMDLTQRAVLSADPVEKELLFSQAEGQARAALKQAPDNPDNLFSLAMTLGLWIDYVGVRDKVRMGDEVYRTAQRILEIDPDHPGGHHVMGRLHSGAMNLSRVARFVAHRLLGASMLGMASWEGAEHHLRQAEVLDPGIMIHHLELAVLYLKLDRPEDAAVEIDHTLALDDRFPMDALYRQRALDYRAILSSGQIPSDPTSFISGPVGIKGGGGSPSPSPRPSGR